MRVGFDARWYNDSGVGAYVAGLVRAMASARREFDLVVYVDPSNPVPGLERSTAKIVPVRAAKYSVAEQFELSRRAREDKLDVFHSPFFVVPLRLPCPLVVTIHDLIPFLFRIYPWPQQALIKTGYRLAARKSRQIIAVSRTTARDVRALLPVSDDRVICVYNAVRQDCFHPQADAGEEEMLASQFNVRSPYVVAASARNWRTKNLAGALRSLKLVQKETVANFQIVVYGAPDGLASASREENIRSCELVSPGYLPAASLAALFRHARAFLMPSLYEGFGLPVLEAMSSGCPVLTSNRGSLPEIVGNGAQIFDPYDVEGMAQALTLLLTDRTAAASWKQKALTRAADFSWERAAQETMAVYDRAASDPAPNHAVESAGLS